MDKLTILHGSMAPRVALIAHDTCKADLTEWAIFNRETLDRCELYGTDTTGERIERATGLPVERLLSGPAGPAGGDAQVGAMLAEKRLLLSQRV